MLREDKKKLLSMALVVLVIAAALLAMGLTPAGEKLFDIDPDEVDQSIFRWRWTSIDDRSTIEAVVEHFNDYRYNRVNELPRGTEWPTREVTFVLGVEELTVSLTPWGVLGEDGSVLYSSDLWLDYFEPLYQAMHE